MPKIQGFLSIAAIFVSLGCDVTSGQSSSSSFEIYRLKDTTLNARQVWNLPIDSLTLADKPFLPQDSLLSYQWRTHTFSVAPSIDSELTRLGKQRNESWGIPFVVTVGKRPIYLGAFWYCYSSLTPSVPYIEVLPLSYQIKKAVLPIDSVDRRNDPRIYSALKNAGILVE